MKLSAASVLVACALLLPCLGALADSALPMKSTPAATTTAPAAISARPAALAAMDAAATGALPDGHALMRRFVDACGGVGAFAKVRNIEMKGTLSIPAQGMSGSVAIYQDQPNKVLAVTELGPIKLEQGFDGVTGWARDPIQGPRLLAGAELEQLKSSGGEIEVFGYANPDEYFTKATTVARTTFESKDAWKVAVETKGGEKMIIYLDPVTMLQLGLEATVNSAMGEVPVVVSLADWKDFAGMKVPTRMTQTMMGMEAFTTIETMNVNLAVLPSFAPPAEVMAAASGN